MKPVPMQTRIIVPVMLMLGSTSIAHAQSKTVTFSTPSTQNVLTINLVDNQPVTIGTTGNLAARCTANPAGTQCAGVPTGGGGGSNPATASLSGSIANGQTAVAPGSQITLTPVSNGAVCLRRSNPTTAWGPSGSFGNAILATIDAGDAQAITLSSGNTQYTFDLQCYGEGGASSVQSWTVTTAAGGGGGPANCSSITAPPGFTRTAISTFQQLQTVNGPPMNPFPNSGGGFGVLGQTTTQYTSLEFTVPPDITPCSPTATEGACRIGQFDKNDVTSVSPLNDENYFFTISECPGDFRIAPIAGAPPGDPTFALGCRNATVGSVSSGRQINWGVYSAQNYQPSSVSQCNLEFGKTYYFNFILDTPRDGVINTQGAAQGCLQGETFCGTGIRYRMF